MQVTKLIEDFPKGNPPIQLDVFKAIDHYVGLENVYEIRGSLNFTLIMDGEPFIFIDKNLPYKRKHFILTHELVEYLLEVNKSTYSIHYYLYKGMDKKFQAKVNSIVSQLLMPENVIKNIVDETLLYTGHINCDLISELSDFFAVSKMAVKVRLKKLGYEVLI